MASERCSEGYMWARGSLAFSTRGSARVGIDMSIMTIVAAVTVELRRNRRIHPVLGRVRTGAAVPGHDTDRRAAPASCIVPGDTRLGFGGGFLGFGTNGRSVHARIQEAGPALASRVALVKHLRILVLVAPRRRDLFESSVTYLAEAHPRRAPENSVPFPALNSRCKRPWLPVAVPKASPRPPDKDVAVLPPKPAIRRDVFFEAPAELAWRRAFPVAVERLFRVLRRRWDLIGFVGVDRL
mmetsp:Transcript_25040/g.78107  ORF Transcript_25040/g.78107 Transcript_25040/m.78107 type:complete len:240 (+) Transcript_25040:22-741(+)